MVRRYYLAQLRYFLKPSEETLYTWQSLIRELAKQNRPLRFPAVLVEHQKEFERLCATLEEHYHQKAADFTLYQFISRLETLKEKFAKQYGPAQPE